MNYGQDVWPGQVVTRLVPPFPPFLRGWLARVEDATRRLRWSACVFRACGWPLGLAEDRGQLSQTWARAGFNSVVYAAGSAPDLRPAFRHGPWGSTRGIGKTLWENGREQSIDVVGSNFDIPCSSLFFPECMCVRAHVSSASLHNSPVRLGVVTPF